MVIVLLLLEVPSFRLKNVLSFNAAELSRISKTPNYCVQSVHQLELHYGAKIRLRYKTHKISAGISA